MDNLKLITIDGPAGSGKSTVAKLLAAKLGWTYITTGAIYRTLALLLQEAKVHYKTINSHHIERFVSFLTERYRQESATGKVYIGERELTQDIQNPAISNLASIIAQDSYIRKKLLPLQRRIVLENFGAVNDGRDMGTVVFPQAPIKIYLTASVEERARRRHKELLANGEDIIFEKLIYEIQERDNRDSTRESAPLKPAVDAILIDSTHFSQQEIVQQIFQMALNKNLSNA